MHTAAFIFPHQLFDRHPVIREDVVKAFLIEESLFFGDDQYPLTFHRQKLAYHLATLDDYEKQLSKRLQVERVGYTGKASLLDILISGLAREGFECLLVADVHDFELQKRLEKACLKSKIRLEVLPTPAFLNTPDENREYRSGRKRWFMADFYQWQRRRFDVLMDGDKPVGGQWSFDEDNRKKMPASEIALIQALADQAANHADQAGLQADR